MTLYQITDDEFQAHRYLKEAISIAPPSEDACAKVCEILARFKQHQEILPMRAALTRMDTKNDIWKKSPVLVDFCEAMLNEAKGKPEDVLKILAELKHPTAAELLCVIAKGSFGPDSLRLQVLNILKMRGDKSCTLK